jgi:hypothetical protein
MAYDIAEGKLKIMYAGEMSPRRRKKYALVGDTGKKERGKKPMSRG